MEVKKGYKQTEIGYLPIEWTAKHFGEICSLSKGKVSPTTTAKNYKCVELEHISQGTGILLGYTESKELKSQKTIFSKHNILFGKLRPYLRKYLYPDFDGICTTEIWVFKPVAGIESRFLYHLVQSNRFIEVANQSTGTKMPRAEWNTVKKLIVGIPDSKTEQASIAKALSETDNLIATLEKLIAKKEAIKKGTMQALLTGKNRLPGFNEKWKYKTLGEIGECFIGLTYTPSDVSESGLLVLRSSNIKNNSISFDDNVYVNIDVPEKLITRKGDLLICVRNGSRNLIGKCAMINKQAVNQTFGAFMSVFRSAYNDFIFHVFQSNIIKKQIDENIGATINQITNKNLNLFKIPFPEKDEQAAITEVLNDISNETVQLEEKLAKYKQLKAGLMNQLLTGKIRLV